MGDWSDLRDIFYSILGNTNVYFQKPESVKMEYPAIVFNFSRVENVYATNDVYGQKKRYEVTLIDPNPNSLYLEPLSKLRYCQHDRHFVNDGLYHDTFTLYF